MSSNGEISAARRGRSMNSSKESQSHSRWECKYRVVFISKYRKKSLYGWVREDVEEAIPRRIMDRAKNFVAQNSWARGYYVSKVSRDEEQGTQLHHREKMDKRLEQPK